MIVRIRCARLAVGMKVWVSRRAFKGWGILAGSETACGHQQSRHWGRSTRANFRVYSRPKATTVYTRKGGGARRLSTVMLPFTGQGRPKADIAVLILPSRTGVFKSTNQNEHTTPRSAGPAGTVTSRGLSAGTGPGPPGTPLGRKRQRSRSLRETAKSNGNPCHFRSCYAFVSYGHAGGRGRQGSSGSSRDAFFRALS